MKGFVKDSRLIRKVLIVEDEMINRAILENIVSRDYHVTCAENGKQALDIIKEEDYGFSLILLDLIMPVMSGFEFLELRSTDERLGKIPVIVMTAENEAEVKSLRKGAADFISKPFDMPEVILARCDRIIKLSEDTGIINSTKNDHVTGLYSREFFFEYIHQYLPLVSLELDAVVLNLDRFHLINELKGRKGGDRVLKIIGELIGELLLEGDGIACRTEADTFYALRIHRDDYGELFENIGRELAERTGLPRIRMRAGIYQRVDRGDLVELWFDRAKIACDRIRGDFTRNVEFYSEALHEKSLFHERLINDLQQAIDNRDIRVFYQPKYKIQGDRPHLSSAEALVRWVHPELGFISPAEFVPLFEGNGLIQKIDNYVWREAANQVHSWKEKYGISVPVSVNVSRIDIADPELESKLTGIIKESELSPGELMLEITETAYADNGSQLVEVVEHMRSIGFKIEMDDFGSGYSSLNMITSLPIDVLKMDIRFIRNMLKDEKSLRLVRVVIDIAKFLDVPVVAEGVEDEQQLLTLKEMGCECIQGYYFSKPVPPEEFEQFIVKELENRE